MFRLIIRALFKSSSGQREWQRLPPALPNTRIPVIKRKSAPISPFAKRAPTPTATGPTTVTGKCYVIDGDTIQIGKVRLRLAGIDAPELEHPWGNKAKWELIQLCKGQIITARLEPGISYDRIVATCFLPDGRDLSAEMVQRGLALDWPKFSRGKYAHLEPAEARRKHWKAAARQRGEMSVFHK